MSAFVGEVLGLRDGLPLARGNLKFWYCHCDCGFSNGFCVYLSDLGFYLLVMGWVTLVIGQAGCSLLGLRAGLHWCSDFGGWSR